MARIAVLEHNQKTTDRPLRSMKLSAGKSLFFSGRADWIIKNRLLQLFPPGVVHVPLSAEPLPENEPKITRERMPAAEVRGVRFLDPVKAPVMPRMRMLTRQTRLEQVVMRERKEGESLREYRAYAASMIDLPPVRESVQA